MVVGGGPGGERRRALLLVVVAVVPPELLPRVVLVPFDVSMMEEVLRGPFRFLVVVVPLPLPLLLLLLLRLLVVVVDEDEVKGLVYDPKECGSGCGEADEVEDVELSLNHETRRRPCPDNKDCP